MGSQPGAELWAQRLNWRNRIFTHMKIRQDDLQIGSEASTRCDVSIGFLSQIERGKSSPTLDVLTKLAEVLEVPFSEVCVANGEATSSEGATPERKGFRISSLRACHRQKIELSRSGIMKQSLVAQSSGMAFSFYLMEMDKGATSGGAPYSHVIAGRYHRLGSTLTGSTLSAERERLFRSGCHRRRFKAFSRVRAAPKRPALGAGRDQTRPGSPRVRLCRPMRWSDGRGLPDVQRSLPSD